MNPGAGELLSPAVAEAAQGLEQFRVGVNGAIEAARVATLVDPRHTTSLSQQMAPPVRTHAHPMSAGAPWIAARDNLRAAFNTAVVNTDAETALRIAVALGAYAGVWTEPRSWCHLALDLPGAAQHPLRAAARASPARVPGSSDATSRPSSSPMQPSRWPVPATKPGATRTNQERPR